MPLKIPTLDDRSYQQLLDESLARIPIHNPEWTNFNASDPGVTLLELFAFLTESLLYRANQIPERSRHKFLSLLGLGLQPATSAQGVVTLSNERGALTTLTLGAGLEVRAGPVPFRTVRPVDVLPVEALVVYKSPAAPDPRLEDYYAQLYRSFGGGAAPAPLRLYRTTLFSTRGTEPIDLATETVDRSLWIALLVRPCDQPPPPADERARERAANLVREQLAGATLSLGLVPANTTSGVAVPPGGLQPPQALAELRFQVPVLPPGGELPEDPARRNASYRTLAAIPVPGQPLVTEVPLPATASELGLWSNLDPLESGTQDFPPALEDTDQSLRIITWLRILAPGPADARLLWAGINAAAVTQRAHVDGERLPDGSGEPDQQATLSQRPVLPGTVAVTVTPVGAALPAPWNEIEDLAAAGPEVPVADPRARPGSPQPPPPANVFSVDAEAGLLRFGDGFRGARPPPGAVVRASYHFGLGAAGNVGPRSINSGPALPAGLKVENPVATWGGADAETAAAGEKQIARSLQHRDRLVSAVDFETIALRTPGVAVGRVDVLPAFSPALGASEPGDAPGAVTVLVIPAGDPDPPPEGQPDPFLRAVACWLAPRRLVTTELFVRRPVYRPIWVSVGLELVAGASQVGVREAVKQALGRFLSPLPDDGVELLDEQVSLFGSPQHSHSRRGWPLRKPVLQLELLAVAARVPGVALVSGVRLASASGAETDHLELSGLELPRLAGPVSVNLGAPLSIDDLRGASPPASSPFVPVPMVPEECR